MSDMMNEFSNKNDIFDSVDLSFDTGNAVADAALNIGTRVAIGAISVVVGNLLFFGGKKGFEAIGTKIEEAKAAKQAAPQQAQAVNADVVQ